MIHRIFTAGLGVLVLAGCAHRGDRVHGPEGPSRMPSHRSSVDVPARQGHLQDSCVAERELLPMGLAIPRLDQGITDPAAIAPEDVDGLSRGVIEKLRSADQCCADFQVFAGSWVMASEVERLYQMPELLVAAVLRRQALRQLVMGDPERALARRIPWMVRRALPSVVQAQLEERISARGDLVARAIGDDGKHPQCTRQVLAIFGGRQLKASPYGAKNRQLPRLHGDFYGIAVGDEMAVAAGSARTLEPGEPLVPGTLVRLANASVAANHVDPSAVTLLQVGPGYQALPRGMTVSQALNQVDTEAALAHKAAMQSQPAWTTGGKRILVVRIRFSDQTVMPSQAAMEAVGAGLDKHWRAVSYGQTWVASWDTPAVNLPMTEIQYNQAEASGGPAAGWTEAAYAAAKAANPSYDRAHYDLYALRSGPSPSNGSPLATIGAAGTWLIDDRIDNAIHEFGHNLGLEHANLWMCHSVIGSEGVGHFEYGNRYDLMGFGTNDTQWWPYNAGKRRRLNWLPETAIAHVPVPTADDVRVVTLYPSDHPTVLGPSQPQALRCEPSGSLSYMAEFVTGLWGGTTSASVVTAGSANPWVRQGLMLRWDAFMPGFYDIDRLIDLHPGGSMWRDDAVIHLGETFTDRQSHLFITPLHRIAGTPERMEVRIARGQFVNNRAPNVSLVFSTTTPAVGQRVDCSASASDPEGDDLAYAWDFGDGTFGKTDDNSPNPTHTWSRGGVYQVVCTVSDGRGGSTIRQMTINVGGATGSALTGLVLRDGIGVPGVRVMAALTSSALADVQPMVTVTDADGRYCFPAQSPGIGYQLAAYADDAVVSPQFTLPATLGMDRNFLLSDLPIISIQGTSGALTEGQSTTLSVTRTGPTTQPLTVVLSSVGSANFTNPIDVDLKSPDGLVVPWVYDDDLGRLVAAVTIPAGQVSLPCTLAIRTDTILEPEEIVGVEVLDRHCAPAAENYRVQWPARASVYIRGAPAPANDHFSQAIALTGVSVTATGTCVGATLEPGEPALPDPLNGESVWWKWTAPSSGLTVFATRGSSLDTILTVATGATLGGLAVLGTDDDGGDGGRSSRLLLPTTAGTVYYLRVATFLSGGGTSTSSRFTLTVSHTTTAPPRLAGLPTTLNLIAGQVIPPLPFTVADTATAASDLQVTVASLSSTVLPDDLDHRQVTGGGAARILTLRTDEGARGTATIRVTVLDGQGLSVTGDMTLNIRAPSTPFSGTASPVPGHIEAEFYDAGGEGVGYHDVSTGGHLRAIRSQDAVGLRYRATSGGGYDVNGIADGEWLHYTVAVATGGQYQLSAAVTAQIGGGGMRWSCDGVPVTGKMAVPMSVAPEQAMMLTAESLSLSVGTHVLRVEFLGGGFCFDGFDLVLSRADPSIAITQQPVDQMVIAPGVATFQVVALREPVGALSYQWEEDLGTGYQSLPGATLPTLALVTGFDMSGRSYRCRISALGIPDSISDGARLTVIPANQAPTVAQASAASGQPLVGTPLEVHALGADDGGEDALIYTWSVIGTAPGTVTFSPNASHLARTTQVTFSTAGRYEVLCTMADVAGLSVSSALALDVEAGNSEGSIGTGGVGTSNPPPSSSGAGGGSGGGGSGGGCGLGSGLGLFLAFFISNRRSRSRQ